MSGWVLGRSRWEVPTHLAVLRKTRHSCLPWPFEPWLFEKDGLSEKRLTTFWRKKGTKNAVKEGLGHSLRKTEGSSAMTAQLERGSLFSCLAKARTVAA